jgi:hypothetical protein
MKKTLDDGGLLVAIDLPFRRSVSPANERRE